MRISSGATTGCILLAFLGFFSVSLPAQQRPFVHAPHEPVEPLLAQPKSWHKPAVAQSLIGGLWMIDPNLKATITITNDLVVSPLTVTPVLWLSNGAKYTLPPVNLPSSGTAIVDINQSLAA
jgi:hypothetical protein